MEHQRVTQSVQKEQPKTSPSSLRYQTSLNQVAAQPLLELQQTIGNQAVLSLLRARNTQIDTPTLTSGEPRFCHDFSQIPIHSTQTTALQAKLRVSQPGDVYEQEADQVAEQVMRMTDSEPPLSDDKDEVKNSLMRKQSGELRASTITGFPDIPSVVHDVVNGGGGQPLDTATRAFMEPRFGHDFSPVRVHTDADADAASQSLNARAFTMGRHVVFAAGEYHPQSEHGRRLLAHELVHVQQQRSAAVHSLTDLTAQRREKPSPTTADYSSTNADQLQEMLDSTVNVYEELVKNSPPGVERARYHRIYLLLYYGPQEPFTNPKDVDQFIDSSIETAKSEDDTLQALAKSIKQDNLLLKDGMGFPETWAKKISWEQSYSVSNITSLSSSAGAARENALTLASNVSKDVLNRGLPLSPDQARNLRKTDILDLVLDSRRATDGSDEVISRYIRVLIQWERANFYYELVSVHERLLRGQVDSIRKGEVVVDSDEYQHLQATWNAFRWRSDLLQIATASSDMKKTLLTLLLLEPQKFNGFRFAKWPDEGVQVLWREIGKIDDQIAKTGKIMSTAKAFTWANERGFFMAAGEEVWNGIKDNLPQMVGTMISILILQEIPGVDIAVDIVLMIEFGLDIVVTLADLVTALIHAGGANSVVEMEHASAELASKLVGTGAEIALWAATWRLAKGGKQLAKYRKVKKFLNKYSDNPQTRDVLVKTRGDVEEAEKLLAKQLEQQRQQRELQEVGKRREPADTERRGQQEEEADAKRKRDEEVATKRQREEEAASKTRDQTKVEADKQNMEKRIDDVKDRKIQIRSEIEEATQRGKQRLSREQRAALDQEKAALGREYQLAIEKENRLQQLYDQLGISQYARARAFSYSDTAGKEVFRRSSGLDEMSGKKPSMPSIDHVVSIAEMSTFEGFDDLHPDDLKAVLSRTDNLRLMEKDLNSSKVQKRWANWTEGRRFYGEAVWQKMVELERRLSVLIQDDIKTRVAKRRRY